MTGLVGYRSSDEEDFIDEDRRWQSQSQILKESALSVRGNQRSRISSEKEPVIASTEDEAAQHDEAYSGNPYQVMTTEAHSNTSSPHANHCATIRSLTLPTMPNLDIPQSPPGSPIPGADQKFSHFLGLKKEGVHFNTKLATSSALKNPGLLPRLMDFAGVDSERQYTATLPAKLWDPSGFPSWAYMEELAEAQQNFVRIKEEGSLKRQRESIEFVTAGTQDN